MATETDLTVALTGPTGTFGSGLVPLLEQDHRVARTVGVARSAFEPAERGWTKMTYHRGDVQDADALARAFTGADVVVHLAFLILGGSRSTTRAVNVGGTLNAFRAAAEAGVRRFVYASSVAAYGFHRDNPLGMTEDWPVRPADRLFYAQQKAEIEQLLQTESQQHPEMELYLVRPSIVVGPHTVGGKLDVPDALAALAPLARLLPSRGGRLPVPLPVVVPDVPLQLVHEDDVGRALLQCVVAAGPPGAYNIAADDVVSAVDIARELGAKPVRVPAAVGHVAARAMSRLPLPATLQWVEAGSQPAVMDTGRAKALLGWQPRFTALEALRTALG